MVSTIYGCRLCFENGLRVWYMVIEEESKKAQSERIELHGCLAKHGLYSLISRYTVVHAQVCHQTSY